MCIDPHPWALSWQAMQQLLARGHEKRIIWDSLDQLDHTPKYQFLKRSRARNHLVQAKENHDQAEHFTEVKCRRREQSSLATSPLTEEWDLKSSLFLLNQPVDYPASDVRFALRPDHKKFVRMLHGCTEEDSRREFEKVYSGAIRPSQYAAALRLNDAACGNPPLLLAAAARSISLGF